TTGYGYAHNLDPALVEKIKQAFFTFPWEGSALKAEFKNEDRFIPITYQKDWSVIRKIDAATGVKYACKESSGRKSGRSRMLRIKGLTKRYRTGDLALKGIDLDVPDGEVMALIGPSGAGKSTVIRCINRLVEPTAGTVTLNDIEITTLGGAELR